MTRSNTQDELIFIPLGGIGEIGMNLYLYGFGPPRQRDWLMIDLGTQTEVQYYEIRGRDDVIVSSPLEWSFEGSNDNSNWTVLDLRSEQDSWVQGEHVAFHLLNPQSWRYFRIVANGNPGGYSITCFQEMALFGP